MKCEQAVHVGGFELLITFGSLIFAIMAVLIVLERVARRTDELMRDDDESEP